MPAFTANPRPVAPKGGVKIALREGPGGAYVSLTLNAEVQERAFGRRLAKGEPMMMTLNSDPGKTHILLITSTDKGEIQVGGFMRGAVRLEAAPWRGCDTTPRKAVACAQLALRDGTVAVRLPDWAQPKAEGRA